MSSFDADAYLEALGPPVVKLDGTVHTGRFLSIEEWTPFEKRMKAIQENKASQEDIQLFIKNYCDEAFAPSWLQMLNPFRRTVAEKVLRLPPAALMKVAHYFFECQARGLDAVRAMEDEDPEIKLVVSQ